MPPVVGARSSENRLLAAVRRKERKSVVDRCEVVDLKFGTTLVEPESTIHYVYFPLTGFISLITPDSASESLEVGLVGNEGMFGITVMLGIDASPLQGLVQGAGTALRMSADDYRQELSRNASFTTIMNAYLYVLMAQIAQTAACGRFHRLEQRLARWLLMTHDRAGTNTFRITQLFLSKMLGVRRTGVSEAIGLLEDKKLLYGRHGEIQVLNRAGLEKVACPCYEAFNAMYTKHLDMKRG